MKYSFKNDYSEGCHPEILKALAESNLIQQGGYGQDAYSQKASGLIRKRCDAPEASVYFVSGGTQANLLVVSAILKSYECVVSASSGHINTNETGAIEYTGHKILSVPSEDGKLTPDSILPVLEAQHNFPHQVKPRMVYISNSTELGTVYTRAELTALHRFCREKGLILFMDGARLGSALTSPANDMTLADIASLTDVFYIGGTKNGALFGEAIVVPNKNILQDFDFHIKQKGAMLAKGRALGVQFMRLFDDNLYFELARHANRKASEMQVKMEDKGIPFLVAPSSNQLFPVLNMEQIATLENDFEFYIWKKTDDQHAAVRLITSWATPDDAVERFCKIVEKF